MTEPHNEIEILYSPGEVADTLKVQDSTVRKYAGILEGAGYIFSKNNRGHRQYKEKDVMALKKFIAASERPDMTLEAAAEQIVAIYNTSSVTVTDTNDIAPHEQHSKDIAELKELVLNQSNVIKELIGRLDQREQEMEQYFKERDKKLMETMRQLHEQKQEMLQLAAAKEEEVKSQKNKGFFSRLFGRK